MEFGSGFSRCRSPDGEPKNEGADGKGVPHGGSSVIELENRGGKEKPESQKRIQPAETLKFRTRCNAQNGNEGDGDSGDDAVPCGTGNGGVPEYPRGEQQPESG